MLAKCLSLIKTKWNYVNSSSISISYSSIPQIAQKVQFTERDQLGKYEKPIQIRLCVVKITTKSYQWFQNKQQQNNNSNKQDTSETFLYKIARALGSMFLSVIERF